MSTNIVLGSILYGPRISTAKNRAADTADDKSASKAGTASATSFSADIFTLCQVFQPAGTDKTEQTADQIPLTDLTKALNKEAAMLDYPDSTVRAFTEEALSWKDDSGRPLMEISKVVLDKARDEYRSGRISMADLVKIETATINKLGRKIRAQFDFNLDVRDLASTLVSRQAECITYTEMVYVAAAALGFPVQGVKVPAKHGACLVGISDNRGVIVDLAVKPTMVITEPFKLEEIYQKDGKYLVLKPEYRNMPDIRLYKRIQLLDLNGIIACRYNNLMEASSESGKDSLSKVYFNKAIGHDSAFAEAYYNFGIDCSNAGKYGEAFRYFKKAIDNDPEYAKAYCQFGVAYMDSGLSERAIAYFDSAKSIDPEYANPHYYRGIIFYKLGQYGSAIAEYEKAVSIDPDYAEAYNSLGFAYIMALGKPEQAIDILNKAIKLDPKLSSAYVNLGHANFKLLRYQEAIKLYTTALGIDPDNAVTLKSRGNALIRAGQFDKGMEDLRKAAQLNPELQPEYEEELKDLRSRGSIKAR